MSARLTGCLVWRLFSDISLFFYAGDFKSLDNHTMTSSVCQ